MRYQFIAEHRYDSPISILCRVLEVSVSGFSAWLKRPPSRHSREDASLTEKVKTVFQTDRGVYGSPRVHAEVQDQGIRCARKRVARLMREQGLFAKRSRHRSVPTHSEPGAPVAPNLLQRDFTASQPNAKWVADTTDIWTAEGWLYLAVVRDLFSRMVGGWSMAATQDATLVVQALRMAITRRRPQAGWLHHSDRGSTYTSESYQALLKQEGMIVSMSRPADCSDHAAMESFFHSLKGECLDDQSFQTRAQARSVTFDSIETFYNRTRRHSTLQSLSPFRYEQLMCEPSSLGDSTHSGEDQWVERYGHRIEESRLPKSEGERLALAQQIGADGQRVLMTCFQARDLDWLRQIPAIEVLRRIWVQNYFFDEDGHLRWREVGNLPPATLLINSPYDPEAHRGKKRTTLWTGYKVHLTETCERNLPHFITHVATTPAPKTDEAMTERIQEELHQADISPAEHFVDAGYVSARVLVNSQTRFGIEVVGPVSVDTQWQAHTPSGIDASQFVLDWERRLATCPQGKTSTSWSWVSRKSHPELIKIQFSTTDCQSCPRLSDCVQSTSKYPRRTMVIRPQAQHAALQAARKLQQTEIFQQKYALRRGVEATISQGVRAFDLRRSRSVGLPKTHLQHLAISTAINLVRLVNWLDGIPLAPTRASAFERLSKAA